MTSQRTPEPLFELLQADDFSQYLLRERREISFILRQLAAKRTMITAYYGRQHAFLMTSVIGISADERQVFLDLGADEQSITTALGDGHLLCITQLDKVKVQFGLSCMQRITLDGFPALQAPIPDVLLRLQRREYYRLAAPTAHALICQIPLEGKGTVEARVVDISGGGVAVVAPPNGMELEPDTLYPRCKLILPDHGPVTATLQIRNVFRMTAQGNIEIIRAGCRFLDLSVPMANAIQRYILNAERSRQSHS